ncbi:MAG TPA: GspH/FimT family pseudopilin [Methylomirabilota bacterium]|nr:GspH/FimT family pseudopilin [Methylomirabilota bacterium]
MLHRVVRRPTSGGFTTGEVLVVLAILGTLALASMPTLIGYWRASTVKAAAEELVAGLNNARHLALARNRNVCVELVDGTKRYRFWLGTCGGGTVWNGPGTATNGFYTLAGDVTVTKNPPGNNPVFDRLGAAPAQAVFRIADAQGLTRDVVVAPSGRVTK